MQHKPTFPSSKRAASKFARRREKPLSARPLAWLVKLKLKPARRPRSVQKLFTARCAKPKVTSSVLTAVPFRSQRRVPLACCPWRSAHGGYHPRRFGRKNLIRNTGHSNRTANSAQNFFSVRITLSQAPQQPSISCADCRFKWTKSGAAVEKIRPVARGRSNVKRQASPPILNLQCVGSTLATGQWAFQGPAHRPGSMQGI